MKTYFISKWYTNINGSHPLGYEIMGSSKAIALAYLKHLNSNNDNKHIFYYMDWIWKCDPVSYMTNRSELITTDIATS